MPTEPTNTQRAQRARTAVIAYRKAADTNETRDGALLANLLADLMHLAASCGGVNFEHSLAYARSNYSAEQIQEICGRAESSCQPSAVSPQS